MLENRIKAALAAGQSVLGAFIGTSDPRLVDICGQAGFDYVLIDAEHYPFTTGEIEGLARAAELAGMASLVRVPTNEPQVIRETLDAGPWGVMIPQVHDRAEAEAAVRAVKFAPLGTRGASVPRVAGYGNTMKLGEWAQISNDQTMVIIQIETREAVDNLAEIMEVPGIDAFELGRSDLSQSLGVPGQGDHPLVREYHDKAVAAILGAGRVLGDTTDDPSQASDFLARGYRMVACNLTRLAFKAGQAYVTAARHASTDG